MISDGFVEKFSSESIFARIDPRAKLVLVICIVVLVFVWNDPIYLWLLVLGIAILSLLSGIPISFLNRLILITLPFAVILLLIHGILNKWYGITPLVVIPAAVPLIGGWTFLYKEGTLFGLGMAARTYALMLSMPMIIYTTDMNKFVLALIKFGVPYKITFVFTTALRFAPLLIQEMQAIQDAQRLRGLDTAKMSILQRGKILAAMVVPLILGAMTKSMQLEIALQAKAFSGSSKRTYLHKIEMSNFDWAVTALVIIGTLVAVVLRYWLGYGGFEFINNIYT